MALATSSVMISRNLSFSARTLANACTSRPVAMRLRGARPLADRAGCGRVGPCCHPPVPDVTVCPPPPGPCVPCCNGGPCELCAPPCPCPPANRPCGQHCIKAQGQGSCPPKKNPPCAPKTSTKTASAAGGEAMRRSASCTQVASGPGRQLDAPVLRVESATLIHMRHSSGKAHDADCPCPSPCGPCGCPKGCGCLPPPCNLPPKCIQYMTGYYYYPYGTWFAGPYHVQGMCQPVGKDSLSCDERSGSPPCPPKDRCEQSSNSILDYCKKIKKQCSPAKVNCSRPPSPSCPPKPACPPAKPACPPAKPACPPPKSACPPPKAACPPPKPACPPPKPTCPPPKPACPPSKPACPPSKAKSLEEICKSTKKPFPPNPPNPSKPSCPPVAKSKSSRGIFGGKKEAASCPSTVLYETLPAKTDKAAKSIFEFYLKSPQRPSNAPDRS